MPFFAAEPPLLEPLDCCALPCDAPSLWLRVLWPLPLLRRLELWRVEPLPPRALRALDPLPLLELALRPLAPLRELALRPLDAPRELALLELALRPLDPLRGLRELDPLDELARVLSLPLLDPFAFRFWLRPRVARWPLPLPADRFDEPRLLLGRLEEPPRPLVADIVHLLLFDSHA
jgi:hypothetical protein